MSGYDAWQLAAERAIEGAEGSDAPDQEELRALAARARELWPELRPPEREAVLGSLRDLATRLEAGMARIERELQRAGERRAGVRGYGQLRASSRGQRLRRRA